MTSADSPNPDRRPPTDPYRDNGIAGPHSYVGAPRIHLESDGCNHLAGNVCPACAELTDAEVAALREYFKLLEEKRRG